MRLNHSLAAFFLTCTMIAEVSADDVILLPVSGAQVPGAYGTLWTTETFLRNGGQQPVYIARSDCAITSCYVAYAAQMTFWIRPTEDEDRYLVLSVRGDTDRITMASVVRETSRSAEMSETELPVVRKAQFRSEIELLNIRVHPNFRLNLRGYLFSDDPTALSDSAHIEVEFFRMESKEYEIEEILLGRRTIYVEPGRPYWLLPDLVASIPDVFGASRLRVRLRVITPASARMWAFITSTDNETQRVTIFTPQ